MLLEGGLDATPNSVPTPNGGAGHKGARDGIWDSHMSSTCSHIPHRSTSPCSCYSRQPLPPTAEPNVTESLFSLCVLTAEIQHCLVNAGDVGCGVFECFENNSCEIRGLHGICMTFLHNAGKFDAQVRTASSPKRTKREDEASQS